MPQYKRTQYGLKQYGTFIPLDRPHSSRRLQFIRSRFGIRRNGQTFWLYQHQPATVSGRIDRLRLRTNTGETLYENQVTVHGRHGRVRLSGSNGETLISQTKEGDDHT